jgi:peptidylprolyl isomerase
MTNIVQIDGEVFSAEELIKLLKLTGRFDGIMEEVLQHLVAIKRAKKMNITTKPDEVQLRADQFRRVFGLHKAEDTAEFFDDMGVSLEDFESFVCDMLLQEKVFKDVCSEVAVKQFFSLNSPRFESLEASHILMENEGAAREMVSVLEDDPDSFEEMAREHSIADTSSEGGALGKLTRGIIGGDIEARLFSASEGDIVGPLPAEGGEGYEIFKVTVRNEPLLDQETAEEIVKILREEWLTDIMDEHQIEFL